MGFFCRTVFHLHFCWRILPVVLVIAVSCCYMRIKKTRGLRRAAKRIERWRQYFLSRDVVSPLYDNRHYAEILVHPWSGLTLTNSKVAEPGGKIKQQILTALLDIYDNWEQQLEKTAKPYYLKLWLFEPRFSKSQVVCATGDSVAFYENQFSAPDADKKVDLQKYGSVGKRLIPFTWQGFIDEDAYTNDDVGQVEQYRTLKEYEESVQWFKRLLAKPHRTEKLKQAVGDITESYFFKMGYVWEGGKP